MSDGTEPLGPLARRVNELMNDAGRLSEFWLQGVVTGSPRQPGDLTPQEHLDLLSRMVGAHMFCVMEIARAVDALGG